MVEWIDPIAMFFEQNPAWLPVGVLVGVFVAVWIFKRIVIFQLKQLSKRTETSIDDILVESIDAVQWPFFLLVGVFAAIQFMALPVFVVNVVHAAALVVTVYYAVRVLQKIIRLSADRYAQKREETGESDSAPIRFLSRLLSYALWVIAALVVLDNAGYDINALIAGLGVAGIAIALAVQNILSDVFSSLSIYFDKPFKIGDFLVMGNEMGTVQKIGIKTTRIQALQGEEIVMSNRELTDTRIHNYGRMNRRRVEVQLGVVYETEASKLRLIIDLIRQSVEKVPGATLDRAHFKGFGDFALIFEFVYYVPSADYNAYMDARQAINLGLVEFFRENKIEFAYPTQKVFVTRENP